MSETKRIVGTIGMGVEKTVQVLERIHEDMLVSCVQHDEMPWGLETRRLAERERPWEVLKKVKEAGEENPEARFNLRVELI
jgi:hypothetical protein